MRRAAAALVTALAAGGLALAGPGALSPAGACSIAPDTQTPEQFLARADVVFEGVALSSNDPRAGAPLISSGDPIFWTFSVDRVTKGSPGAQPVVSTARSGATCGFEFRAGARYVVYATGTPDSLRTGLGSGTRELSLRATTTAPPTTPPSSAPPATPRPGEVRLTG